MMFRPGNIGHLGRLGLVAAAVRALFNPASLFANGEQGVWYDPSDLSTLFQDSAGTTPVTAVEQPVGLMLDKRLGLVLGSELRSSVVAARVGSGSAATATYNTMTGQGTFERVDASNQTYLRISGLASNRFYRIRLTNTGLGDISIRQDTINSVVAIITPGTTVTVHISTTTFTDISIVGNVNARVNTCTVLALNELPGNHAFQTTAIDRPILRNRYNLLTKTEQFDDAAWVKSQTAVSANAVTAPDGTLTADTVTITIDNASSYVTQQLSLPASTAFVFRVWVLKGTANGVTPSVRDATGASILATITPALQVGVWQQVTLSFTTTASGTYNFWIGRNGTGTTSLWGASLVPADQSHLPYQRVNTSTDYDSDASKFPLYLSANGTNTWMQTNSIDFTGTDKVTVFAGVRKLSDAEAVIFEFSTGSAFSTNGSFALYARAPSSADSNMVFRSRGTSVADVFRPAASPISVIASASSDIGGDAARLRVNGVSATPFLGDQGAGPYGNYPFYLFRRAGTSSPANIQFHGLLISGALHADSKNAAMERWLAPKTGVAL